MSPVIPPRGLGRLSEPDRGGGQRLDLRRFGAGVMSWFHSRRHHLCRDSRSFRDDEHGLCQRRRCVRAHRGRPEPGVPVQLRPRRCGPGGQSGQTGAIDLSGYLAPQQVGAATTWGPIATGNEHVCNVRTDGKLWCWGLTTEVSWAWAKPPTGSARCRSASPPPGDHRAPARRTPAPPAPTAPCGAGDSNAKGQLGLGDTTDRTTPTLVTVAGRRRHLPRPDSGQHHPRRHLSR